jgi:hypothetical protein
LDDTAEEEAVFGGDGVRALTSTTFRLSEDNDEEIAEAETTVVDTSSDRSEADDEEEENAVPLLLTRVSFAEGGDEDLDRGSTSTTFNAQEDEEEDVKETGLQNAEDFGSKRALITMKESGTDDEHFL